MKRYTILVLPGDGIGKTVTQACIPIFHALDVPCKLEYAEIGWSCWEKFGNAVPTETWKKIQQADAILLGATTSKPQQEAKAAFNNVLSAESPQYISPITQLRKNLSLYANIRPCFSIKQNKLFNFSIIRENLEGLYAGFDFAELPQALNSIVQTDPYWHAKSSQPISCTLRLQSQSGLEQIYRFAFEYASKQGFKQVTLADKPNVLRNSCTLNRRIFEQIAGKFKNIEASILNVDAVAMQIVRKPEIFGVIVTENMFGDILSDVAAGMMGGLGLAPSANIGTNYCYFEPVHGTGLNMANKQANPSAMFFSIVLLLEHLDMRQKSKQLKQVVKEVISAGRCLTYDLGGNATTQEMANVIIQQASLLQKQSVSL